MDIDIQHVRNPLMGWDVKVKVNGAKGELVSSVRIDVNGTGDANDIDPPVNIFSKSLTQKGVYPGDNEVRVTVRDPKGTETSAVDLWSA